MEVIMEVTEEVTENTAFMDTVEATDMDGEIVISISINLMPYLINNDDGGVQSCSKSKQYLIDPKGPLCDDWVSVY